MRSPTAKSAVAEPTITSGDLRTVFAAQARLLAARAEYHLPIIDESLKNLNRVYMNLIVEELTATEVPGR